MRLCSVNERSRPYSRARSAAFEDRKFIVVSTTHSTKRDEDHTNLMGDLFPDQKSSGFEVPLVVPKNLSNPRALHQGK